MRDDCAGLGRGVADAVKRGFEVVVPYLLSPD